MENTMKWKDYNKTKYNNINAEDAIEREVSWRCLWESDGYGIRRWRRLWNERTEWRNIVEEAKTHTGL